MNTPLDTILAMNGQLNPTNPQQQALVNQANYVNNPMPDYVQHGLEDSHFGPPDNAGVRKINQSGIDALNNLHSNNGIADNSNVMAAGQNGAAANMMDNAGATQAPALPGIQQSQFGQQVGKNLMDHYMDPSGKSGGGAAKVAELIAKIFA